MMKLTVKPFVAVALLVVSSFANSTPIDGSLLFGSDSWSKDGSVLTMSGPVVFETAGDLVGQSTLTISTLNYSVFTAGSVLWETEDFSFTLNSLSIESETSDSLVLAGGGILSNPTGSLEATAGTWSFQSYPVAAGFGFTWLAASGSEVSSVGVPEPGSVALLGLGLIVFGLVGIRGRKQNTA